MKIQAPNKQKNVIAPFFLAIFILIALGAGLVTILYSQNTSAVQPFEIQSFAGKTEISLDGKTWTAPNRGEAVGVSNWVSTGPTGEVDLAFGKSTFVRVKENSKIQIQTPQVFSKAAGRIHLQQGTLLISSQEDDLQVSVPSQPTVKNQGFLYDLFAKFVVSAQHATFSVTSIPEKGTYQVSVLQGQLQVAPGIPYKSTSLKGLEMIQGGSFEKAAISQVEWAKVREAYEITPKSAAKEAQQIDLARKAGNFFNYVFDHGAFYQEKWGWSSREFIVPEEVGAPVYLQTDYDVFPKGSWVGLYFKTRNFDFSKFKTFSLDARRAAGQNYPDYIRIEFKTKYTAIRTFAIKMVREDWQTFSFPVTFSKETPITEVTVLFTNDKVGPNKAGAVQFKNFKLEAAPEKPAVSAVLPVAVKAPVAVTKAAATKVVTPKASPAAPSPAKPAAKPPAAVGDALDFK